MDRKTFVESLIWYKNLKLLDYSSETGSYTYSCGFCGCTYTAHWDTNNFSKSLGKMGCKKCSKTYTGKYRAKQLAKENVLTFKEVANKLNVLDSNVHSIVATSGVSIFKIPECFYILEKDFEKVEKTYSTSKGEKISKHRKSVVASTKKEGFVSYKKLSERLGLKHGRITEWVKRLQLKPIQLGIEMFLGCEDIEKLEKYLLYRKTESFRKAKDAKRLQTLANRSPEEKAYTRERRSKSIKATLERRADEDWRKVRQKAYARYVYEDEKFDSSWELAVWIYAKDHNWKITREPKSFEYTINGTIHRYFPDFEIDGKLIEIKGDHFFDENGKLRIPFKDKRCYRLEEKQKCAEVNNVTFWKYSDIKKYIEYVETKYGKDFLKNQRV